MDAMVRVMIVLLAMTLAACSSPADSAPPSLPGDQIVFSVISSGGLTPPVIYALDSPSLVIYGDGRVLTIAKESGLQVLPARYEVARIDPAAVASFVSSVASRGIVNPATDFGTPRVTDLPSTRVMINAGSGPVWAGAYAFTPQFENDLTAAQRDARAALRAIIDQADGLAAGAPRTPFTPDRVVVYEIDPRYGGDAASKAWPGPPPATFLHSSDKRRAIACGELLADPAEEVYRAALDNPGARWLVDGVTRTLAVNPMPAAEDC